MSLRSIAVAACLTFAACEGEVAGEPMVPDAGDGVVAPIDAGVEQPQEETGELLYKQRCASCHGASGEGSELAYQVRSPVRAYALWVVRNGRDEHTWPAGMAPISAVSLSDEKVGKIFDYLHAVELPSDGQGLYTRFCGNCHGVEGTGGRSRENILEEAVKKPRKIEEAVREGHGRNKFHDAKEYMPAWRADELTSAQVQAITDYLRAVAPGHIDDDDDDDDDDD